MEELKTNEIKKAKGKIIYNRPLETKVLESWLPHRPPMVWVKTILWSDEDGGECLVDLNEIPLASTDGFLRQSSMIEIMAQSFGFVMAHYHYHFKSQYTGFKKTFVISYKKMSFSHHNIRGDKILRVMVNKEREISTIAFVNGKVISNDGNLIYCKGQLKLFSEV
ncbi:MAG: hypothetical protein VXY34_08510 [Bdellovibrionota bacterium]|nr:hypothetical protein [Bdellovibrionota bacterium]